MFEDSNRGSLNYKDQGNNYLVIVIVYAKCVSRGITKKGNCCCCCLHKVVNSGTQNCVNLRAYILNVFKNQKCNN